MKASTGGSNEYMGMEREEGGGRTVRDDDGTGCSQNEGNHESDEGEKQAQAETLAGVPDTAAVVGIRYDDAQQAGNER